MISDKTFKMGITLIYANYANLNALDEFALGFVKTELDSLGDEIFKEACKAVARSGEPPWHLLSAIRQAAANAMGFLDSDQAFKLLDNLLDAWYDPDLGQSAYNIICEKLKEKSQERLIPYLNRFGAEIYNRQNPTALRAQFRRAYEARLENEIEQFLLEAPRKKMLKDDAAVTKGKS